MALKVSIRRLFSLFAATAVIAFSASMMISFLGSQAVHAAEDDKPKIFTPESKPYGMSYGQRTAEWWNWFISIPSDENPINDPTGEKCGASQTGQVWNLVGSGGGTADRKCTIPAGVAILIPAINVECSMVEDESLKTVDDLRNCAKTDQDHVTKTSATLDGVEVKVERVAYAPFNVTFPANNVIAVPEGSSMAATDGYWVFLNPLSPGDHLLHVQGLLVDYTETGPVNLVEDSTYHLQVQAPTSMPPASKSAVMYSGTVAIADKSFDFPINSTSKVSHIKFDEGKRQISFNLTSFADGANPTEITTVSMPISWLLEGPYNVVMDDVQVSDYKTSNNTNTNETLLSFNYTGGGSHAVVISGTNVVPELPFATLTLLACLVPLMIIGRARLVR